MDQVRWVIIVDKDLQGSIADTVHNIGIADTSETHAGYLRIAVKKGHVYLAHQDMVQRNSGYYLCGANFVNALKHLLQTPDVERHGPAMKMAGDIELGFEEPALNRVMKQIWCWLSNALCGLEKAGPSDSVHQDGHQMT